MRQFLGINGILDSLNAWVNMATFEQQIGQSKQCMSEDGSSGVSFVHS